MFWENGELSRKAGIGSVPSRVGRHLMGREQGGDSDEEVGCSLFICTKAKCISHRSPYFVSKS